MPDPYQELDVFGRPKSRVDGVPYAAFDDDLAALQNYVLNLRAKEEAIESGARMPRRVKEIVRDGGRLPGYVHPYEPGYVVQEQERLRDETDPVQFLPIVRQGVENVRAIYNEGPETPEYIDAKLFGQRAPQYLNTLGSQVRKGGPGFEARFGEWQDPWAIGGDPALRGSLPGRTQMWPEKMARSGAALPGDVMSGRVMTGPGLRSTDFSDIPGAPNPLAPLIERTQDLAGMAMGGSIPELAARGVDRNALGSGFVPKITKELPPKAANSNAAIPGPVPFPERLYTNYAKAIKPEDVLTSEPVWSGAERLSNETGMGYSEAFAQIANEFWRRQGANKYITPELAQAYIKRARSGLTLAADDEVGGAVGASRNALKDLTSGSFGGNVPPSAARNIGRETMPEILARQRASEGYEAAIRDSETKKVTTGMWHEEVIDKIAKERGIPRDDVNLLVSSPDKGNLVKGYVDHNGKFWTEAQMERKSQSRTAMFRADDEVGAAVAAMHATEGKPPTLAEATAYAQEMAGGALDWKRHTPEAQQEWLRRAYDQIIKKRTRDADADADADAVKAPTFYSGLARTIERAPFETATPSQWMKHLRDTVGARQAEEFEHVGLEGRLGPLAEVKAPVERKAQAALEEWKAANKGQRPPKELTDAASNENKRIVEQRLAEKSNEKPLTKAELLAHVAGNQPKFKEIVKRGDQDDSEAAIHRRAEEIMGEQFPDVGPEHPRFHDTFANAAYQAEDELINSGQQAKYSDYQLPGGTNYREHLMTMPSKIKPFAEWSKERGYGDHEGARNLYNDIINGKTDAVHPDQHRSSHWDEPNVIVHTRMNDRDLSGDRSLHAEEFQSDLHQEGRKQGYDEKDFSKWTATSEERPREWGPTGTFKRWTVKDENGNKIGTVDDVSSAKEAIQYATINQPRGVPNFPFKKSWPDLAIKRWLREAADNDYDAVSWTPGEAQRDRFQLAHSIDNLTYAKHPNGTYTVEGERKNDGGTVKINRGLPVKENELAQHVGEAVAEKIKNNMGQHHELDNVRTLHNTDLKVGGEGLVSFYDKTVKGKVEALVEKFGGKVEKHALPGYEIHEPNSYNASLGEGVRVDNNANKVPLPDKDFKTRAEAEKWIKDHGSIWSVKLTPEMKRAIRSEGFPLFTAGPVMTPVDHDPFDKKQKPKPKLEPVEHDPFAQPTPDLGGTLNKLISATGGYRPRPRPIQNGFGRRQ